MVLQFLPEDTDFKSTTKVTFLADDAEEALVDVTAVEYGSLITKPYLSKDEDYLNFVAPKSKYELQMTGSSTLLSLQQGEIVQIQRKGFFICDRPANPLLKRPLVLVYIPDGHAKTFIMDREPSARLVSAEEYAALEQEVLAQKKVLVTIKKAKADKNDIRAAESRLKELEEALAQVRAPEGAAGGAGKDKSASSSAAATAESAAELHPDAAHLLEAVKTQAEKVQDMKAKGADKAAVLAEVQQLKDLKEQYKQLTGQEPPSIAPKAGQPAAKATPKAAETKEKAKKDEAKPAKEPAKKAAEPSVAAAVASAGASAAAAAAPAAATGGSSQRGVWEALFVFDRR